MNISKIMIGTAQFGLDYGIANKKGKIKVADIKKILNLAILKNISFIDTAVSYGKSERLLGREGLNQFSVITKLPELPFKNGDILNWLLEQVASSLDRLKLSSIEGLLLHKPEQLLEPNGEQIYQALLYLKEKRYINKFGISIYSPNILESILNKFNLDIVQCPLNVFDNRLVDSEWVEKLKKKKISIHVRSIFLQGLLLMPKSSRPKKFDRWKKHWDDWENWLLETNQTPLEACLKHSLSFNFVEKVIVGVDSFKQFEIITNSLNGKNFKLPDHLKCNDELLLNPYLWEKL